MYRFLLPRLLTSHTDVLQTKMAFYTHLETLYGAYFKTKVSRIGQYHAMTITLTMIDPKSVLDDTLLKEGLALFYDVLHRSKSFSKQIFNEEKRLLIEQWESLKDKKRTYAGHQFQALFYEDDHEGYPISGTLEDIKKMTHLKLERYYHDVFLKNQVFVVVNGVLTNAEKAQILNACRHTDVMQLEDVNLSFRPLRDVKTVFESTKMNQAMIRMGYHFPIFRQDALYHAAWLVDTMLGGYPESRLFKEIREKQGLCYDISSSYNAYKGTIHIGLGVDILQKEFALDEVKNLVESIKSNGFSQDELNVAKSYIKHQLKMSLDHQSVLTERAFLKMMFHETWTIDDRIHMIDQITMDDIHQCLAKLNLDTIFVLHGGAND
ncbi:MAG: M16 family metallopeptidase [Acholeplasmataceae bacterium]